MSAPTTAEFLLKLKAEGVRIWLEDGRVRVSLPKDGAVPELRAALQARREEIAAFLRSAAGRHAGDSALPPLPPLRPRDGRDTAPLSFGQRRVFMLHEFNKHQAIPYDTLTWSVRLRGPLDAGALRRSLSKIAERHEVLRSTVTMRDGEPVALIRAPAPVPLEEIDVDVAGPADIEGAVRRSVEAAAATFVDLEQGPLFRCRLLRFGQDDAMLVIILHHIIFDAWSPGVFARELELCYGAYARGAEPSLPKLEVQYGDFAAWQRDWLAGGALESELAYWKPKLEGVAPLELPTDFARPPVQTYRGVRADLELGPDVVVPLLRLAAANGATTFTMMVAALSVLLSRYSGQSDIAIGTPITNRDRTELHGLIGYFLNTVVFRLATSPERPFIEFLADVRRTVLDGLAHQHLPFEMLVDALDVARDPGRSPLFQVLLVVQSETEAPSLHLADLEVAGVESPGTTSRFDLEFYFFQRGESLAFRCVYNPDLFRADTIERMQRHFAMLLRSIAAAPATPVGRLGMLAAEERQRMLVEWNDTDRELPAACLHDLVAAQARRTPQGIAVSDARASLTYEQLDARAASLARRLGAEGVGPGDLVGVCVDRGALLVVALLGILKAGGAYLPLDLSLPRSRLAYMLADSRAGALVAERRAAAELPPSARTIFVDDPEVVPAAEAAAAGEAAPDAPSPASRAYVIYTSGSTGKPKGVQISHRAVVNFLRAMSARPGIEPADVLLAVTTVTFDIHVLELFLPLVRGARVHLVSREDAADGRRLLALLQTSGASVMQATPTTWRMLLEAGWTERLPLKVLCGGEPLPPNLARQLLGRCHELWNMYGPTETTVWSSVFRVTEAAAEVPVGMPIDNTRFYVLDASQEPVPVGVNGELYIGGAGVADGYVGRPELTAERFVPDPFTASGRLYRTGDSARYLQDGNLQLLGRKDNQLKIRGFRIELGEIESVLAEHPGVAAAAAAAHPGPAGEPQLVAYAVPRSAPTSSPAELRDFLQERLPRYMVPAAVVWLDALPLTSSGKVDRKALPQPDRSAERERPESARPQGELEILMAGIWSEVLEVDDIYADDGFFDLGGHSLLALKVVERFERETGLSMRPVDLVNQTLRQVVAGISARQTAADASYAPGKSGWLKTLKGALSGTG
jgi:amino acid adenylation domain-containing protein